MSEEFQGEVEFSNQTYVKGWAFNPVNPKAIVELDVICDGHPFGKIRCDAFRWDKKNQGHGDGTCGFMYKIPSELQDGHTHELTFLFTATRTEVAGSPVRIGNRADKDATPYHCSSLLHHRVLVVSPHPDDESIGLGGSLYLHCQNEDPTKVVFLTDGAQGDFRNEYATDEYVELRAQEAKSACSVLGIDDLDFWGLPDSKLQADEHTVNRLVELLQQYAPTLIYAPSPLEWHPDHKAAAEILWQALNKSKNLHALVAFYEIYHPLRVNVLIDISSAVSAKTAACNTYVSQLKNAPHTEIAIGMNRYRSLSVCNQAEYVEGFYVMRSEQIAGREPWYFFREQFAPSLKKFSNATPLVSILVRTKDRPVLLQDALSSIAMQKYPNIEAVVVNDGGEDVTEIVQQFQKLIPVRYFSFEQTAGRSAAANKGLALAKGKYINLLDDDDILYTNHVARLVDFLETTAETSAFSDHEMGIYRWDTSGQRYCDEMRAGLEEDFNPVNFAKVNSIPSMCMMFRADLLTQINGFDEELEYLEDWDFWLRLTQHSIPSRLPGITAQYRVFRRNVPDRPGYDYQVWREKVEAKHSLRVSK